jgi:hypothetical protein
MMSPQKKRNLSGKIIYASDNNLKIQFRLRSTPVGEYILFHPYSLFFDDLLLKNKVYGLIENHYYDTSINNHPYCISVDKLAELVVTENSFGRPLDWKTRIDQGRYRVISAAHILPSIKADYCSQPVGNLKGKEFS